MFSLALPEGTSLRWIFSTIVSLLVNIFITSVISLLFKAYVVNRILKYFEKRKRIKEKQAEEQPESEEENESDKEDEDQDDDQVNVRRTRKQVSGEKTDVLT